MTRTTSSTIAVLFCLLVATNAFYKSDSPQRRCSILVMQCGGDLGAFEVGVLKGMFETLPAGSLDYDVLSGISVGAINALGMSQYAIGDDKHMTELLIEFWRQITPSSIYSQYPGGIAQGLIFESGLVDTQPERETLRSKASETPKRKLNIGVTNLRTGQLERFNETYSLSEIIEFVMASSAVPGIFPYQTINGEVYVDGGTSQLLDYSGAINRCLEIVEDESQIDIDSIFVQHAAEVTDWTGKNKKSAYEVYQRSQQIQGFANTYREYTEAQTYHPKANFRYLIKPLKALPFAKAPYSFSPVQIEKMIQQGISDSKTILAVEVQDHNVAEVDQFDELLEDLNIAETAQNRLIAKEKIMQRIPFLKKLIRSV